jgi:hypothetical protein
MQAGTADGFAHPQTAGALTDSVDVAAEAAAAAVAAAPL